MTRNWSPHFRSLNCHTSKDENWEKYKVYKNSLYILFVGDLENTLVVQSDRRMHFKMIIVPVADLGEGREDNGPSLEEKFFDFA
jgi:hypothetical protein